ncbi:redoxin domain-containing protein, partial [Alphaproteobacteria bacterium]|nr:redoxin domain-containing protein [Alphaproteobacteria bacterium]
INRIVIDFNELNSLEVGTVAIMPNDVDSYPEDSYENMIIFAKENNFQFHYLYDKNQQVARAYNAVCTPDFFCFDKNSELFYRGRLDDLKYKSKSFLSRKKDLVNAVKLNIKKGLTIDNQNSSMGCSIKWKNL